MSRAQILKYVRRWVPQSGVMLVGVDRASPDRDRSVVEPCLLLAAPGVRVDVAVPLNGLQMIR